MVPFLDTLSPFWSKTQLTFYLSLGISVDAKINNHSNFLARIDNYFKGHFSSTWKNVLTEFNCCLKPFSVIPYNDIIACFFLPFLFLQCLNSLLLFSEFSCFLPLPIDASKVLELQPCHSSQCYHCLFCFFFLFRFS